MNQYRPPCKRRTALSLAGNMSQFAFVRRSFLEDGRARGLEMLEFNNGSGFCFTVLPGRGMDIANASFKGTPLCHIAKAGIVSAQEYDAAEMNWLFSFFAGLLTTCGLSNVGDPSEDMDPELGCVSHGLHGRISNTGADNVGYSASWEDENSYVLRATGRMREARLHAEALTLTRHIHSKMGEKRLFIEDLVENEGFEARPLMLLYHINPGYPVLSKESRIILPTLSRMPGTEAALAEPEGYRTFSEPIHRAPQYVYNHVLAAGTDGSTQCALVNASLELGLYVRFNINELPCFAQWKRLSQGDYVVGLEPANTRAIGRSSAKASGELKWIQPGERLAFHLEIGVLEGAEEIAEFEREVGLLLD